VTYYHEFYTDLFNHRYFFIEYWLWERRAFDDDGVRYVPADERGLQNEGAAKFEYIMNRFASLELQ